MSGLLRVAASSNPSLKLAPTAGHQARSGDRRYIFASPSLASCRCYPLTLKPLSNVTVKAPEHPGVRMPPAVLRDINKRWARPLEFSGESSAGGGRLWRRPVADGLELFDPAWRGLLRTHGGVVGTLIDLRLASAEHHQYQPDHLVRDGDEGFLVRVVHHPAAVLCGQRALGVSSGECKKSTRPRAGRLLESLPIRVSLPCVLQPGAPKCAKPRDSWGFEPARCRSG